MVNSHQQQQNISNSLEKRRISRAIFYIKRVIDDFEKFVAFSIATTNVKEVNHSYENKNKEFIADARIKAKEILDTYNHQFNAFIAKKSIDAAITDSLIRECFLLWDTINKQSNSANYYASNCIEENWGDPTYCRQLFEQITEYHRRIFAGLNANRKKYENTLNSLFNYYCNTSDLSDDDCLLYRQMVINSNDSNMQIGNLVQPLLVSALTLNNLKFYSEQNMQLLAESIESPNMQVKARALTGVILVIDEYSVRYKYFEELRQITMKLKAAYSSMLLQSLLALIRTTETEHLNDIMNNEIVPEILKRTSEMSDKEKRTIDIEKLIGNPDWTDYKNSLEHKIIQLSELQAEGSDVAYNTFKNQKNFPFFKKHSNWFIPFDKKWSDIPKMFDKSSIQIERLFSSQCLCDSDCYSFCMTFSAFSDSNTLDLNNLIARNMPDKEENSGDIDLGNKDTMATTINNYVHNLYRFYKLNLMRDSDVIDNVVNYHKSVIPLLFGDNSGQQMEIANFYFNKQQYKPALDMYEGLSNSTPSSELFQKMGFAAEQLGNNEQALRYYTIADTYSPDEQWTLKRMLACTKDSLLQNKIYQKLLAHDENNRTALLGIAQNHSDNKEYDQAMDIYYKLDFLYPDSLVIQRRLALCAVKKGDYDTALRYWDKINRQNNNCNDLINTAHTYFIKGDRQAAIDIYKRAWEADEKKSDFWSIFRNENNILNDMHVSDEAIHWLEEILINELYN